MGLSNNLGKLSNMITSTGSAVGIAQSSPSYTLDVSGTGRYTGTLLVGGNASITSTSTDPVGLTITGGDEAFVKFMQGAGALKNWGIISSNLGVNDFGFYQSTSNGGDPFTAGTPKLYINGSGNVGIGTSSPSAKLEITNGRVLLNNGYSYQFYNTSSVAVDTLQMFTDGNVYLDAKDSTGGNLIFRTSNSVTERMRITSGGNVGINETAPNARLDIVGPSNAPNTYGTLVFRNTSNTGIAFGASGTSYTWMQGNVFGSGYQMICINPNGSNVSIGTTTDFGYKLNLNGQPGCNGYTAWTNWSDSRLKENITDLETTNVLDKICAIRPVTYNYNELSGFDEATRSRRISGFIAQELMEVFPDMVGKITKDEVEYYDTNLSNLDLYLVKAIQEMNEKITLLEQAK